MAIPVRPTRSALQITAWMVCAAMGRAAIPVRVVSKLIPARQMVNADLYWLATTQEMIVPLRVFIHVGKTDFVTVQVDAKPILMPQCVAPLCVLAVIHAMCPCVRVGVVWCLHPWTANFTRAARRSVWILA